MVETGPDQVNLLLLCDNQRTENKEKSKPPLRSRVRMPLTLEGHIIPSQGMDPPFRSPAEGAEQLCSQVKVARKACCWGLRSWCLASWVWRRFLCHLSHLYLLPVSHRSQG